MHEKPQSLNEHTDRISPIEVRALSQRASKVNGEHSLDMTEFIDTFGIDKVKSDYAKVAERMQGHLERKMNDSEKLGHIFEAAFLDLASRHG